MPESPEFDAAIWSLLLDLLPTITFHGWDNSWDYSLLLDLASNEASEAKVPSASAVPVASNLNLTGFPPPIPGSWSVQAPPVSEEKPYLSSRRIQTASVVVWLSRFRSALFS